MGYGETRIVISELEWENAQNCKRGSRQLLLSFDTEMKKYPRFSVDRRTVRNVSRDTVTVPYVTDTRPVVQHHLLLNDTPQLTLSNGLVRTPSHTQYSYSHIIIGIRRRRRRRHDASRCAGIIIRQTMMGVKLFYFSYY